MSTEALTFAQYPFLKDLGLEEDNLGCYNGKWFGSGKDIVCYNPTTNKPIARVRGVSDFLFCVQFILHSCNYPLVFPSNLQKTQINLRKFVGSYTRQNTIHHLSEFTFLFAICFPSRL